MSVNDILSVFPDLRPEFVFLLKCSDIRSSQEVNDIIQDVQSLLEQFGLDFVQEATLLYFSDVNTISELNFLFQTFAQFYECCNSPKHCTCKLTRDQDSTALVHLSAMMLKEIVDVVLTNILTLIE